MNEILQTIKQFCVKVWNIELFGSVTIGSLFLLLILFASVIIVERIVQKQ
ncbi:MAG: hypothetical protein HN524_05095, partial [Verrucomicrobia bacterium]|nr:hypothetical protein [Verrucomicrobiota bacterium]